PVSCWGSCLFGEAHDFLDTFLIGPAVALTGGNTATLRFWHRYDFTRKTDFDVKEFGEVLIITNSLSDPVTLAKFVDANSMWEQAEIDLTPYLGTVVSVVWHHSLLAFQSAPRAGWLVDDVEISVTNLPPGQIEISNNLAQAGFSL